MKYGRRKTEILNSERREKMESNAARTGKSLAILMQIEIETLKILKHLR